MSTVVILGGGGFLANHVGRHFEKLGWRVVSIGRRAASTSGGDAHVWELPHPEFARLLAVEQPKLCVNAAGSASVLASMVEPLADFEASALLTFRVLDDIRRHSSATAYINLSSAAVYGNSQMLPIDEGAPIDPISPYGWHKWLSEQLLAEHSKLFGMKTASLRIFSAYGAGLRRQVVWDLATRALSAPDRKLMLRGCPEDSRDFIHCSDVAAAIDAVERRGALQGEVYNVASGVEVRVQKLAELVLHLLDRSSGIEFDNIRIPGNPNRWHADIGKLQVLGFRPLVSLSEGVAEVVEHARNALV